MNKNHIVRNPVKEPNVTLKNRTKRKTRKLRTKLKKESRSSRIVLDAPTPQEKDNLNQSKP